MKILQISTENIRGRHKETLLVLMHLYVKIMKEMRENFKFRYLKTSKGVFWKINWYNFIEKLLVGKLLALLEWKKLGISIHFLLNKVYKWFVSIWQKRRYIFLKYFVGNLVNNSFIWLTNLHQYDPSLAVPNYRKTLLFDLCYKFFIAEFIYPYPLHIKRGLILFTSFRY